MRKTTILNTTEGNTQSVDVQQYLTDHIGDRFSSEEIDAMVRYGTLIGIDPGKALTVEGQVGGEAFIIVAGEAEVAKDGESVATVGAAEIIGEHALITETRRNADVVATEPTSIIAFTSREFGALLAACPNLSSNVQGLAASRKD